MPEKFEQPKQQLDILDNIQSLALKTELNERQKNYLDSLVTLLNKTLSGRTVEQMVADKDLNNLEKYLQTITKINLLLKNKEMPELEYEQEKEEWQQFYQEVFETEMDFTDLKIPEKKDGFNRLLIMKRALILDELIKKCEERFPIFIFLPDGYKIKSDRMANITYPIWLRDRAEADEENRGKSALDCDKAGIKGITLEERLLLELFYNWQTGKHLDTKNTTLCSGSILSDGSVPDVGFTDSTSKVTIGFWDSDNPADTYRVREVIT